MFAWCPRSTTTITIASKLSPNARSTLTAADGGWLSSRTRTRGQRLATRTGPRLGVTRSRWGVSL
eukprot:4840431-Alexandrium_andersonii.AAC.1